MCKVITCDTGRTSLAGTASPATGLTLETENGIMSKGTIQSVQQQQEDDGVAEPFVKDDDKLPQSLLSLALPSSADLTPISNTFTGILWKFLCLHRCYLLLIEYVIKMCIGCTQVCLVLTALAVTLLRLPLQGSSRKESHNGSMLRYYLLPINSYYYQQLTTNGEGCWWWLLMEH
jgi:hypothetical protein